MMRRVVVTGMGAITPLGLNVKEYFEHIKAGDHGFGIISRFDASEYKAHVAAEVKGFSAKEFMDFKAAKRMELFPSMQWQRLRKLWSRQDWIWRKKILTV